ncbi:M3 family oligoendopeptidase [Bacillus marinisedimentorum]|uniref:M3 family oligoendopeptidase n=1 Tax=Bacillus marinisedimentorum TaxID=1821260 RepID=UPI0007DE7869|nr:M3 family oligoendopeptidase [Bacillus marinisedimentorum]
MGQPYSKKWDLDALYPGGSESAQLASLMKELDEEIRKLGETVRGFGTEGTEPIVPRLIKLFKKLQTVMSGVIKAEDFITCLYADNVRDEKAGQLLGAVSGLTASFNSLMGDAGQLFASVPETTWEEMLNQEETEPYRLFLEEQRRLAKEKQFPELEQLFHDLAIDGYHGWRDHYQTLTGEMDIKVEHDGEERILSFGQAMQEAFLSNDRDIRKRTGEAFLAACEKNAALFASVLNHLSGFRLKLYQHRGWTNLLKEPLQNNRMEEETLSAMMQAIDLQKDKLQQYFERKARLLNTEKLSWYDASAPVFQTKKKAGYDDGAEFIISQFHAFSDRMGSLAEKAFEQNWIEAENREGKRQGGFCAEMPLSKQARIFLTYQGTMHDIVTIAHELGHAYHDSILHDEPAFAQKNGMSLAETASTFAENLVIDAAIDNASTDEEKLPLLEMQITNGILYLLTVPMSYQFELKLYEQRQQKLLTPAEIVSLFNDQQDKFFGGHFESHFPYRWIATAHFYMTDKPFYNFPYTFGFLFSNGIYEKAKKEGPAFADQYDALLRDTGKMTVEELAMKHLGEDLTSAEFWNRAIKPTLKAMDQFLELTE